VRFFERAAAEFPRSDYRPAWLYWAGRAHDLLKEPALADERYMLTATDYMNSYYGRLALKRLAGRKPPPRILGEPASALPPPPNEPAIQALLSVDRYDEALNELRYAQRAWGDAPAVQATISYVYRRKGMAESNTTERFNLLRGSITLMRRAYPQFMAAGGQELPRDIQVHIFPMAYWDLISKYSAQNNLDPHLIAALMAQESTFVPGIRSHANAYGLLQLLPSTARQTARRLKIPYSTRLLTNPEANVRIGTAHFADLIRDFGGGVHLALASYNAGESAVRRWINERPGLADREEFIDDIPYPETQNYVKRILGTAEDYRRLYAGS
jgi:soluble lytic murein transglycosylase